jgi:nucleotide-binding universal stress UspA family protein
MDVRMHLLIVDGLHGGFQALRGAALVAEQTGAPVRLVARLPQGAAAFAQDAACERLARRAEVLRVRGIDVTTGTILGEGPEPIVREAVRWGVALVIKSIERRRGFARLLRTSTEQQLLRGCPCPVWLFREEGHADGPVLAAVNPQHGDAAGAALDARILGAASALADCLDTPLHVVHAWTVPCMPLLGRVAIDPQWNRRAIEEGARDAASRVARCLGGAAVFPRRPHVHPVRGDPRIVLPEVAAEIGAHVLVIGQVARSSLAGAVFGNVAERILPDVKCSVLALNPEPVRRPAPLDQPAKLRWLRPVHR